MSWKTEIRILGADFLIPDKEVRRIVEETTNKYPGKSPSYLYDRAWAALKPLMFAV